MPPEYTFISADLRTGRIINELPMRQDTKFGRILNGTGTLEGRLPLGDARFAGVDIHDATDPNRRVIYVDRDGELIWGGIVWGRKYNSSKAEMTITAVEFFSYFIRRFLRTDSVNLFTKFNVDQFDIVRTFLDYVQAETGGNLGIVVSSADSGVLRDREWFGYERKQIGEAIQQIAAVIDGFDFEIGVRYDAGGNPERFLGLYYPRAGRISQQTGLLFDKPGNLVSFDYDEDGTQQSTRTDAVGSGEGDLMLLKTAMDSSLLNQGYPLLEQVVDYKDVTAPATLQAHADGDQQEDRLPFTIMKLRVNSGMTGLNEFVLGDEARVKIEKGDPRFPEGFDESRRIIGWEIQPGATTMELTTENRLSA